MKNWLVALALVFVEMPQSAMQAVGAWWQARRSPRGDLPAAD